MKRIVVFLLTLVLFLSACGSETHTFVQSEKGGYLDEDTEILYRALDSAYEAGRAGNEVGRFTVEKHNYINVFYAIPDMDPTLFLTDDYGDVYYAGTEEMNASRWDVDTVLICRLVGELSEVKGRFDAQNRADLVSAVHEAWFAGEDLGSEVFLLETAVACYPVKMGCAAYPNLYYAIELRVTASGSVYLTDKYGKRVVLPDVALVEELCEVVGYELH